MDADGVALFLERIFEPYTGQPLLGVGGYHSIPDAVIEVRYDGITASRAKSSPVGRAESARPDAVAPQFRFSTQLPFESETRSISVILKTPTSEIVLVTRTPAEVGARAEAASKSEHGFVAKLNGTFKRGVQSVTSGEILSASRWLARYRRILETTLKVKQKLRHKILARKYRPRSIHDGYVERTKLTERDLESQRTAARSLRHRPTISILMPVYEVDPKWFLEALQSVLDQTYERWELCIADDASSRVDLLAEFERLPDDPRIRFRRRTVNGHICDSSNTAADLATGDYIALLDNDDRIAPEALFEMVAALQTRPDADLIYSDEDKIDSRNHRYDPQFKPDWSPELLLSYNYVNHFTVIRRSLFESVGRFRKGYEGSQDHDVLLRVTEKTDRVVHVPKILYHWRSLPTSTASAAGVKTYVHTSGRKAIADALVRRGIAADLVVPAFAAKLGLPILALDTNDESPSVAVIVHGSAAAARITIQSLKTNAAYRNFTPYLVLDADADTLNRIAAARTEDYLLFLEAGHTPVEPRWLNHLLAYARIPGVGALGGHVRADECISYYFYREVARNVGSVSPGILLTRRDQFDRMGGFDSHRYPRTLVVDDYCRRLNGQGLRHVHVGAAEFRLNESAPEQHVDPLEFRTFRRAYGETPPMNPNLEANFALTGDAGLTPVPQSQTLKLFVAAHNLNSPEGAPRYLSEIVLGLHQRNAIEPAIVSPTDGAGAAIYRTIGIPVSVFDEPWAKQFIDGQWTPRTYEAAVNRVMKELIESKPDAVLANTLLTFPVIEAAARLNIPSVWIIHESYSADVLARLFPPYARHRCERAFALASRVIPASHDTAALFRRCDVRSSIRVIHNGIDPAAMDRFLKDVSKRDAVTGIHADASKVHIVSVGTVCERKGQHTLVEAAAILARSRRDFQIHIVGLRDAVPYSDYVKCLVARHDLHDVVSLVPETDRVQLYLRAADVFVCTSHMETFSRSILEAEVFGLPIVSTPCEGVGEQVVWNENALRFEIGDAITLAKHLELLIENTALRESMGRKSRAAFDNHDSYDTMLDHYLAAIQQAAGIRGRYVPQTVPLRAAA